jgi:hypothetical protein
MAMLRVRQFTATVYDRHPAAGQKEAESFPVQAPDYVTARLWAFAYVLQILRLKDFELRMAGS